MATLSVPFFLQSSPPAWPGVDHYSIDLVHRDQGSRVIVFCCFRRGQSGKVKAKKCKIVAQMDVHFDSRWSPRNALRSRHSVYSSSADFHIFNCEFSSKVGIMHAGRACADFFHATKRGCIVMPEVPSGLKSRRQSRFASRCYFLTKPKQLIKFDLIVQISCISPGADA
jgi:hypothetical protein